MILGNQPLHIECDYCISDTDSRCLANLIWLCDNTKPIQSENRKDYPTPNGCCSLHSLSLSLTHIFQIHHTFSLCRPIQYWNSWSAFHKEICVYCTLYVWLILSLWNMTAKSNTNYAFHNAQASLWDQTVCHYSH